ncbi:MAG: hypothetical protein N2044_09655 [Cyclobacteriaceae bacterium]|nr:hypothetical protein [Cyclobacteriaceae bacterium]
MKKLFFSYIVFALAGVVVSAAQSRTQPTKPAQQPDPSGLTLLLGPATYYYQGNPNTAIDRFSRDRISYQLNGFIGYTSPKHRGGNSIGIFGTAGYTTESQFNIIKDYQGLTTDDLIINKYFTFYQVEAGFIIGNALRFSTGAGKQNFTTINGENEYRYLSTTAGLMIGLGPVYWNIDANFNYGRDWPRTAMKLSTGLLVKF